MVEYHGVNVFFSCGDDMEKQVSIRDLWDDDALRASSPNIPVKESSTTKEIPAVKEEERVDA